MRPPAGEADVVADRHCGIGQIPSFRYNALTTIAIVISEPGISREEVMTTCVMSLVLNNS